MSRKLAVLVPLAVTALTASTTVNALPSMFDRSPPVPRVSNFAGDSAAGTWSVPNSLPAGGAEVEGRPPHHPHHHDDVDPAERRECFESLKKACEVSTEFEHDFAKRVARDVTFLQCVQTAAPEAVKPECALRVGTFVVFRELHSLEGSHHHHHQPPSDETKDSPCQSEIKKKCGKQIDAFKDALRQTEVAGVLLEGSAVLQCLLENAEDLIEKCKKQPREDPTSFAAQDLPLVDCSGLQQSVCPFTFSFDDESAFKSSVSALPSQLSCLWRNSAQMGDCFAHAVEASVIPVSSSHHCKDEFKSTCGKHVDDVKHAAHDRDVVKVLKSSLELAACVVEHAEKLYKACAPHGHQEPMILDVIEEQEEEVIAFNNDELFADEDCDYRIQQACPVPQLFAAIRIESAETYSTVLSDKLNRLKCVRDSVETIGATCAAVYAHNLAGIVLAAKADKRPCHDQLHKTCGKQLDALEKAVKETSVLGIITSAVEVVDCVVQHVDAIWEKCKPFEGESSTNSASEIQFDVTASTKKPTGKPAGATKKPTPKPTTLTKKPTPKPTKSTSKKPTPKSTKRFDDESYPALTEACVQAVADRCSGLVNRLASDYAPGAAEELEAQARACIVEVCGEEQASFLLNANNNDLVNNYSGIDSNINEDDDDYPQIINDTPPRHRGPCMKSMIRKHKVPVTAVSLALLFAVVLVVKRRRALRARREAAEAALASGTNTVVVVVDNQESEYFRLKEDGRVTMGELA